MMKAVFRADASAKIGGGHIRRCLTLADALQERGMECVFISNKEAAEVVPYLGRYSQLPVETLPFKADLLIVDHYGLGAEYERSWKNFVGKILVIDDLADRTHDCDFLLDQTYGRLPGDYSALVPERCRLLLGAEYSLLRPQFHNLRDEALARRRGMAGKVDRLLIAFGSADIHNLNVLAMDALSGVGRPLLIDVVLEASHPHLGKTKEIADKLMHEVSFLHNVEDMASLMARADLALGGGGTTSWERCCLGLPTVAFQIAENQSLVLSNLEKQGALINMGAAEKAVAAKLTAVLTDLLSNHQKIINLSQNAAQICDGTGVEKVVQILMQGT